ncbi:MAG: hypothetical protein EBT75_08705, partial [Proteobacteria bacterium]|nr:hypothetical protein [Pseudomonadota bacterium]
PRLGGWLAGNDRHQHHSELVFVVESEVKGAEGQLFCRAKQELASVDLRTGKAKALREDWRKRHG